MKLCNHQARSSEWAPPAAKGHVRDVLMYAALTAAVLAVYLQVLGHGFVSYDDVEYVTANPPVRSGWTWQGLAYAFTATFHLHWHPLTWLAHMTDCRFFGLNPAGHHFSSLLLHLLNSLLLFSVFKRMTLSPWQSAFVAALFALHPLHVESVAWVADRKDVLSAFFLMLTLSAYVRYVERPGAKRYLLWVGLFVLGLMAKPTILTLPLLLLLFDYWPLSRLRRGRVAGRPALEEGYHPPEGVPARTIAQLVVEKLGCVVPMAAVVVVYLQIRQGGAHLFSQMLPGPRDVADAAVLYAGYIGKMVWPANLAVSYPLLEGASAGQAAGAGLLLAAATGLCIRYGRRFPYLPVGWFWYIVTLLPVIGLVRSGPQEMADRYTYVPLIGLFVILAWGVPDLLRRWAHRRRALAAAAAVVIPALMVLSHQQAGHWRDDYSLWEHATRVNPGDHAAHSGLAAELLKQGRLGESAGHLERALALRPDDAQAHYLMGVLFTSRGALDKAATHLSASLRAEPDYVLAHTGMGTVLLQQGRLREAITHLSRAVEIMPGYVKAHYQLGFALLKLGDFDKAVFHFSEVLRIDPEITEARYGLGVTEMTAGRLDEAIGHFSEVLERDPGHAAARHTRETALRMLKSPRPVPVAR